MKPGQLKTLGKNIGIAVIAFHLLAFVAPEIGDLVELKNEINGRSSGFFRDIDKNRLFTFDIGTRALVRETKTFANGNMGLCLIPVNATDVPADSKCVWAYFRKSSPAFHLYSVKGDPTIRTRVLEQWAKEGKTVTLKDGKSAKKTKPAPLPPQMQQVNDPAKAQAAVTIKQTAGVVAAKTPPPPAPSKPKNAAAAPKPSPAPARQKQAGGADAGGDVDTQAVAQGAVQGLDRVNRAGSQAMAPGGDTSCKGDCPKPSLLTYQTKNQCHGHGLNYLEDELDWLLNKSEFSEFLRTPQKELITLACVQRNMQQFSRSSSFYTYCPPERPSGLRTGIPKACLTEEYVNITAKSFNLAANCLGDFILGKSAASREDKNQVAYSIFSLMAQESGLHVNARSGSSNAGGPGQMMPGAVTDVNNNLPRIRRYLQQSQDPACSKVLLEALSQPMNPGSNSCERFQITPKNPNPLKSMAYAFAYQGIIRSSLNTSVFDRAVFGGIVSGQLPDQEVDRMMMELSSWAHNTGAGGLSSRLNPLLTRYERSGKKIRTARDVDQLLIDLSASMGGGNCKKIKGRPPRLEKACYHQDIQSKMAGIGGPSACLAN